MSNKPNMRRLPSGHYLVRTQAGFKRAIKEFFEQHTDHFKPHDIVGHPKKYPSVVQLTWLHGWNEAQARCTPLDVHVQRLRDWLIDLDGE